MVLISSIFLRPVAVEGDAQIGSNITQLHPSSVASEVFYGKESGNYSCMQRGVAVVYSQLYPFVGLLNYTSGIIHHARLQGLNQQFTCSLHVVVT